MTKQKRRNVAPKHLSRASKELWARVSRQCRSAGRQAMLCVALEALDRADEASTIINREGLTSSTKATGMSHVHPLVKVELLNRALFARLWQQLHLQWDPAVDGVIGHDDDDDE